jgi:AbrB family looped-hinge helix DNA binding protein
MNEQLRQLHTTVYMSIQFQLNLVKQLATVKISSKFQVVIPEDVRKKANIKPGQKVVVIEKDGIISIIPQRNLRDLKGSMKELSTKDIREEGDRF